MFKRKPPLPKLGTKKTTKRAMPLRTIIGTFSVLGMMIVGLGVVFVSQQATEEAQLPFSHAADFDPGTGGSKAPEMVSKVLWPVRVDAIKGADNSPAKIGPYDVLGQGEMSEKPAQTSGSTSTTTTRDTRTTEEKLADSIEDLKVLAIQQGSNNSGGSGSSGSSNKKKEDKPKYGDPVSPMQCKTYRLVTIYWRNNINYWRIVPLDANGKEQWSKATKPVQEVDLNTQPWRMPGKGDVQAYHIYVDPIDSSMTQVMVRENKFYTKVAPTNRGQIDWVAESKVAWRETDMRDSANFPENGTVSAYNFYTIVTSNNGEKTRNYFENLWRDNKGYTNDTWKATYNAESRLVLSSVKMGEYRHVSAGDIRAQADYTDPFFKTLHQDFFKGDTRYKRDVPIENGKPNFSKVSGNDVKAVQDISQLPGSGPIQAMTNYIECNTLL